MKSNSISKAIAIDSEVLIALGSNMGDRAAYLEAARAGLAGLAHTRLVHCSRVMETEPVENTNQAKFLNQVVRLVTQLSPHNLLEACLNLENRLGRVRLAHKGPRTIDIDILTYGQVSVDTPTLQLPHPALGHREFLEVLIKDLPTQAAQNS